MQAPGGWNRFAFEVDNLDHVVVELRRAGVRFRNDVVTGVGGRQVVDEARLTRPPRES